MLTAAPKWGLLPLNLCCSGSVSKLCQWLKSVRHGDFCHHHLSKCDSMLLVRLKKCVSKCKCKWKVNACSLWAPSSSYIYPFYSWISTPPRCLTQLLSFITGYRAAPRCPCTLTAAQYTPQHPASSHTGWNCLTSASHTLSSACSTGLRVRLLAHPRELRCCFLLFSQKFSLMASVVLGF